mgnify:CR=1 FL=1
MDHISFFYQTFYLIFRYISSLLPKQTHDKNLKTYHDVLLRADYIGAKLKILHSRCVTQIGVCGIVTLETKNQFYLIARDNRLLKIDKKFCTFEVSTEHFEIVIYGSNFRTAPPFRASGRLTTDHSLLKIL